MQWSQEKEQKKEGSKQARKKGRKDGQKEGWREGRAQTHSMDWEDFELFFHFSLRQTTPTQGTMQKE
jgi:flagellar biosynthesis/type III secretory pathway protein FliH